MSSTRTASQVASESHPSQINDRTHDNPDLETAKSDPPPPYRHPLIPGFHNPPPFLTFLRYNWLDIATQLLCALAAMLIYIFCPPLLPRYFPVFPGIERTSWGMKYSQPYRREYVSTLLSGVVSFFVPALIMGAIALWGTRGFGDANAAIMGLSYALSTAMLLLCLIKVLIGGLRPHFYTVCQPVNPPNVPGIANTAGIPKSPLKFYTVDQVCQGPSHLVSGAQMSFPSGHACAAFAGFGFLALYLNAKYKTLSPGSHYRNYYGPSDLLPYSQAPEGRRPHHWKLVLFMVPWCVAILLALSKLRDQSHHPVDVVGGALLGTLFAHLAYRMVYRSVYNWRTNHIPLGGDGGDRDKGARKEM